MGGVFGTTAGRENPAFQRLDDSKAAEAPLCGKHDIQALFYAMDVMLPIVPLHQEDKCEIARSSYTEWWRIGAAVFSIIGKIATSLALLTYSGVLKPKED